MFRYSVIMSAGKGERMLPFTKKHAKAMVEVAGKPLIWYLLEQISSISEFANITTGYNGKEIREFFSNIYNVSFLDTYRKGNAWWIFNTWLREVNEPVLVSPCDIQTLIDAGFIYRSYQNAGFPACLLIPVEPVSGIEGDYVFGHQGKVLSLSRQQQSGIYCSGLQVINPYQVNRFVNNKIEDFNEVWASLIEKGELYFSDTYPHEWYSINTIEQLNEAVYHIPPIKKKSHAMLFD